MPTEGATSCIPPSALARDGQQAGMSKSRSSGARTGIVVLKPKAHSVGIARGSRGWEDTPRATDRMRPLQSAHRVEKCARPPDCCYTRHLSLRVRPRLAQGSLWGAGRPSKASNLTCGAQGVPPCHQPRSRPVVAPDHPIFARYRVLSPSAPWSYGYVVTQKTAATSTGCNGRKGL